MSFNETKPTHDEKYSFEKLDTSVSDEITADELITSNDELDSLLDDLISGNIDSSPTQSENHIAIDEVTSEDSASAEQLYPKKEYTTQTVLTTKKKPTVLDLLNTPIQLPFSVKNNPEINNIEDQITDEERIENERLEVERVAAEKLEQEKIELEKIINEHMEEGRAEAEVIEKVLLEQKNNNIQQS